MRFIYLVQGQASLVQHFLHLAERRNADAIFLTYDKPIEQAIYFPKSTWAEGRNRLLQEVESLSMDYDYLIYADDDAHFYVGDWDKFEQGLAEFKPAIGVPVVDRTANTVLPYPLFQAQVFSTNDEQLMAIRKDIVKQGRILPYQTQFDQIHWWATCYLQQKLIQGFYPNDVIQFNFCRINNLEHDRYEVQNDSLPTYRGTIDDYLTQNYPAKFAKSNPAQSKLKLALRSLQWGITRWRKGRILSWRALFQHVSSILSNRRYTNESELADKISPQTPYVMYGFGEIGQRVLKQLGSAGQLALVVDKSAIVQSYQKCGIKVHSPARLSDYRNHLIIIATHKFRDEIEAYLVHQLGIPKANLLFLR